MSDVLIEVRLFLIRSPTPQSRCFGAAKALGFAVQLVGNYTFSHGDEAIRL